MTRRILKLLALLLLVLLAWQTVEVLTWHRESNPLPLPADWKKGAYHMHSIYSDGSGDVATIARAAAADKLDFIVLTDHGRPNVLSQQATAWHKKVLVVGASEFSLHAGHMTAVGCPIQGYLYPPETSEVIAEVRRAGGASFLAHPCDSRIPWTDQQADGYSGIEIISAYDAARRRFIFRLPLFPLQYLINPDYALTALLRYPARETTLWDKQLRHAPCSGIYALDAHARISLPGGLAWRFPSYQSMLRLLTIYMQPRVSWHGTAAAAAAKSVAQALCDGHFFSCIESLAAANGFDFYFRGADGRRINMGERSVSKCGELVLKTPFPMTVNIRIVHDGRQVALLAGLHRDETFFPVAAPGAYRAEVFLAHSRFARLPWILANPIYIGPAKLAPLPAENVQPLKQLATESAWFTVEKNVHSYGHCTESADSAGKREIVLDFCLRRERATLDFWAALVHRGTLDFENMRGITMQVRSVPRLRFWLQVRSDAGHDESAFQHSFAAAAEWQRITIPFASLKHLYGPQWVVALNRLSSLIIIIDNGIAWADTKGRLSVKDIALY